MKASNRKFGGRNEKDPATIREIFLLRSTYATIILTPRRLTNGFGPGEHKSHSHRKFKLLFKESVGPKR